MSYIPFCQEHNFITKYDASSNIVVIVKTSYPKPLYKIFFDINCITRLPLVHGTYYGTMVSLYHSATLDIMFCKNKKFSNRHQFMQYLVLKNKTL